MKIAFTTLGCKLNFAESSSIGKALLERGHTRAQRGEEADICIINTCTVTNTADHKDRQTIHRIRRQNPNAIIIVTGCYAQLKPEEIADMNEILSVLTKIIRREEIDDKVVVLKNNITEGTGKDKTTSHEERCETVGTKPTISEVNRAANLLMNYYSSLEETEEQVGETGVIILAEINDKKIKSAE